MLFIIFCLLFSSSRSLLNVFCIFSVLFPRFWIIFTIITLNSFSGRVPISSSFFCSGGFFPYPFICCVFLCLLILLTLLCLWSPFHRLQVCSSCCFWCLPPVAKVGSGACVGFLMWGLVPVFWWMRLDFVFLVGRTTSGGVFWGVCDLMILGSLSANVCDCVPVLLVVLHSVQHCSLLVVEWSWVLVLRWRSLGELSPFDITWSREVSGGPMSWTWLSHLRGSGVAPRHPTWAPRPCQPHSQICLSRWTSAIHLSSLGLHFLTCKYLSYRNTAGESWFTPIPQSFPWLKSARV